MMPNNAFEWTKGRPSPALWPLASGSLLRFGVHMKRVTGIGGIFFNPTMGTVHAL